jgi:starch phosphorylase
MTVLALRTSAKCNAVSRLHGQVAESMWSFLWPGAETPRIGAITNGVHLPSWIGPEMGELLRLRLGRDFEDNVLDAGFEGAVAGIPDAEVWEAHQAQKRRLIRLCRERVLSQFARHGRSPGDLRKLQTILEEDVLTLGFARRFATYKRADLLFRDPARLRAIVGDARRPVQILFAGKAHPADRPGQELIRTIFQASLTPELHGRIVYVENYDMRIARFLVQGVDIWLNTPRRPQEASGTSGMKAAANGVLNFSVLDGWWAEGYDASIGWAVGDDRKDEDHAAQDRDDSAALYRTLSEEIAPTYYNRASQSGIPTRWIARMKKSIGRLGPRFSTQRMVRDYAVKAYVPAAGGRGAEVDEASYWAP